MRRALLRTPAHSHVHPLTLLAEEGQVLHLLPVGTPEPVRHAGVELGDLAGHEREVVRTERQAVRLRDRQQQLERRLAQATLESGESADRDPSG